MSSFYSIVDILTVIPTWATIGAVPTNIREINSFQQAVMYAFFLFKTTRILRPLRMRKKLYYIEEPVQRCLADMVLQLLILILFS